MRMLKKGGGPLGAVGTVRSFMNVVKDIDFDEVRDRAETAPKTLIVAADQSLAENAASQLFGTDERDGVVLDVWEDGESIDASRWDAIIVYDPAGNGVLDRVRKAVGTRGSDHVFFLAQRQPGGRDPVDDIRDEICKHNPDMAPSYGRYFEAWRPAAVRAIVDETSKANAQFALVSNIPAVIPILGGLVAASADLIVLTKNQVMMCYKIAAAHNRDLGNQMGVVRELTPVVGAGFMWRTAARQGASFMPLAAGTIPKVIIAFAGTMTMGRAADYYYRYGNKPSKDQMTMFMEQATEVVKRLPIPGVNGDHSEQDMLKLSNGKGTPENDSSSEVKNA